MKKKKTVRGAAGFTLIEILVVVAIIGMISLIMTIAVSKSLKRQRLETAAQQLSSFFEGAYVKGQTAGATVFVTAVKNADNSCTFSVVADDGTGQLGKVLSTQLVPNDLAVSGISTVPTAFGSNTWPKLTNPPYAAASGNVWCLVCDSLGRTHLPATSASSPPTQATAPQTLSITHQEMLSGTLGPRMRFDLVLGPIWHVNVTKVLL
jgi:prepilin-type N-terminal cleavage/methylation domain-containing protein